MAAANRLAAEGVARPVTYGNIFATLDHRRGLDVADTTLSDLNGRPQSLEDSQQPIRELI